MTCSCKNRDFPGLELNEAPFEVVLHPEYTREVSARAACAGRREQLWAAAHRFPFDYALPNKLPASFHGRCGYVRYFCEAALERAGAPVVARRTLFSVSNVSDLNTEPKAESGAHAQRSSNSCLFCCRRGTVIAAAALKRAGVAPGEALHITADVLNMSDRRVHKTCARLTQVSTHSRNN
ncbi:Arrestin domain-containing protein 3 [Gryllus bimaculatus]|nr:Arrestin domain-containing protein 3 [Gryllus bimaculatus]